MIPLLRLMFVHFLLACTTAIPLMAATQPMRYIYPPPESSADVRTNYYWELLHDVLEETVPKWGPYFLGPSNVSMSRERAEIQLGNSEEISVMVRTTSIERERSFHTIHIPLDKGLTGYRLFLIKASTQVKLDEVRTLDQLRAFTIGQGAKWVDTNILREHGFTVVTSSNYGTLLRMLDSDRFELFARGVNEIGPEFAAGSKTFPGLAIEQRLLLYYPLPRYFFFNRNLESVRLAQRVEEGLRLLKMNGKFERRYQAFKKSLLSDVNLAGRIVIRLDNPYLSSDTPLSDRELWDNLDLELKPKR